MNNKQLDEEMVHMACAHFDRFGGGFNQRLAALWRVADLDNKLILMEAFQPLFRRGYEDAVEWLRLERGKRR